MANGPGLPNGETGSVQGWVRAIRDVGFPIAVVIFFLLMFSGVIPNPISRIEASLIAHRESNERVLSELALAIRQQTRLLALFCTGVVDPNVKAECLR